MYLDCCVASVSLQILIKQCIFAQGWVTGLYNRLLKMNGSWQCCVYSSFPCWCFWEVKFLTLTLTKGKRKGKTPTYLASKKRSVTLSEEKKKAEVILLILRGLNKMFSPESSGKKVCLSRLYDCLTPF